MSATILATMPTSRFSRGGSLAGAYLTIDLAAVVANYRILCARAGSAACAAVVKANAYGLGADRIARALRDDGCRTLFVAHAEEGISLRKVLGPGPRVIVLHGPPPGDEAELPEHELIPVLSAPWQIRAWSNLARQLDRPLPAVLQIDSGMTRFGLSDREIDEITAEPASLMGLDVVLVMSHLACADNPAHPANAAQLATFKGLRKRLPAAPASLAASSGIFLGRDYRFDLVRPGAALYGIAPQLGPTNPMHPVVRLQAKIVQVRDVPAGTSVGYGWTARTDVPARLATVSLGYADGFLPSLSGRAAAWFAGVRLPLVGRVSMDSIVIDVTALPPGAAGPGTLVDLLGPDQSVDALAAAGGTIAYEVLCALGHRLHRTYTEA